MIINKILLTLVKLSENMKKYMKLKQFFSKLVRLGRNFNKLCNIESNCAKSRKFG